MKFDIPNDIFSKFTSIFHLATNNKHRDRPPKDQMIQSLELMINFFWIGKFHLTQLVEFCKGQCIDEPPKKKKKTGPKIKTILDPSLNNLSTRDVNMNFKKFTESVQNQLKENEFVITNKISCDKVIIINQLKIIFSI